MMAGTGTMQSMTGFGSAENGRFTVEIRSVNHRYMEVYFRMPQFLNRHEAEMRKRVKHSFAKGRFDVNVFVAAESGSEVRINTGFVSSLIRSLKEIQKEHALPGAITMDILAGFRDVVISDAVEISEEDLFRVFDAALAGLRDMRSREGDAIGRNLAEILSLVEAGVDAISRASGGLHERLRQRAESRFRELAGDAAVDETRLIQEAFLLAERADITEELTRLKSHAFQFRDILGRGGVIGRKLDFLLQEFMREANTIAAKTSEYGIVATVVDLKTEIEKLREQVQNVQ